MNTTTFCEDCKKQFTTVKHFKRHLLSNSHKLRSSSEKNNLVFCLCSKSFTTRSALYRHRKNCSIYTNSKRTTNANPPEEVLQVLKEKLDKKDQENQEMRDEMNDLRKQVEMLLQQSGKKTTTNNIQTQNNIENQSVNIVVNSFGNENIEHLTDQIICKLIQTAPFTSVPELIQKIHFDPEHPENHNIKLTNKKMNYAEIVKNNKWVTANKKQVIDDVIQNSYNLLDEKFADNKDSISERRQGRFENFQDKYEDNDEETMRNMKNDVDLVLINGTNELHK